MLAKKSFLFVFIIIIITGICSYAEAMEAINVDFNIDGDANDYTGKGAYDTGNAVYDDGVSSWLVYCKGWGKPIGSHRSSHLGDYNEPNNPAIYASQVWIGDTGQNRTWYRNTDYPGPGLMNDGFVRTSGEPNICLWGVNAYQGEFDIYVYGSSAGNFTLSRYGVTATKTVSGGFDGNFVENKNYVIFQAVDINNTNPDELFISYSNKINGLQLVSKKKPVAINKNGTVIAAGLYDVAGEKSGRTDRQSPTLFGPSLINEANWPLHPNVDQIDYGEYMEYDITVDEENKGRYAITADCIPGDDSDAIIGFYLDDANIGTGSRMPGSGPGPTSAVEANLFPGNHTIKWIHSGYDSSSRNYKILDIFIEAAADANLVLPGCSGVVNYGLEYRGDLNGDCRGDYKDLKVITESWLYRNNPDNNPNSRYPRAVMADNPIVYLRFEGDTPMEEIENNWRYYYKYHCCIYDWNLPTLVTYGGPGERTRTMTKKAGGIGKSIFLNTTPVNHAGPPMEWGIDSHIYISTAKGSGGTWNIPYYYYDRYYSAAEPNLGLAKGDITYEFWIKRAAADEPQRLWPNRRLMAAEDATPWREPEPNIFDANEYPYYSTIFTQADINSPAGAPQMDFAESNGVTAAGILRIRCGVQINGQNDWYPGITIPGTDTQWHQMVLVYDQNGIGDPCRYGPGKGDDTNVMDIYLYKDGVLAASTRVIDPNRDLPGHGAGRAKLGPWLNHLLIGASGDWGFGYNGLAGYIDEFAIYPGCLDPNRIAAHYAAWHPRNCDELIERGYGMTGDIDKDCDVDFADFAELASDWLLCNDPAAGCPQNW